jgi:hypothetical protein
MKSSGIIGDRIPLVFGLGMRCLGIPMFMLPNQSEYTMPDGSDVKTP